MSRVRKVKHFTKLSVWLFALSFLAISLVGGYLGVRGNRVQFTSFPAQPYEEVNFPTHARDKLTLNGWYFPAEGEKTAVIVHGWGGHRARLLGLAEFLQRKGINVLTFDLRGGTGKNSYGQYEAKDLAGAIRWLQSDKNESASDISVIGVSMGAAASIVYAAEHPLDKLILLSPLVDIHAAKELALKNRNFIWPNLYATGASIVERLIFGVHPTNPRDVFSNIVASTLIIHGRADDLTPVETIYTLESEVKESQKSNVIIEYLDNEGHKFMDTDSENGFPISQRISEFILAKPTSN